MVRTYLRMRVLHWMRFKRYRVTLAKLIANISDAAKLQSASAGHIATTMNVVQEITSQTTSATFDTARSVSELGEHGGIVT